MKEIYLPKETIAKGITILICGVASIMKMFGVELVNDVTETELYTAILTLVDAVVFLYVGVFKNFVTSVSNDSHTKQMREAKKLAKEKPYTVDEPKEV